MTRLSLYALLLAGCAHPSEQVEQAAPPFPTLPPRTSAFLVPAESARQAGYQQAWSPSAEQAAAFEADFAGIDDELASFGRQYIVSIRADRRVLRVVLFCPESMKGRDWSREAYRGLSETLCIRYAEYDLETRKVKPEWFPSGYPAGDR